MKAVTTINANLKRPLKAGEKIMISITAVNAAATALPPMSLSGTNLEALS